MTTQPPPTPPPAQPLGPAVPAAQQGQDPRQSQMAIRYNASDHERNWNQERTERGWGHSRPFSVYVAAMGNHWTKGSWAAVMDAVQFANENGLYCAMEEIQDRCTRPYDAIGTMRNEAALRAQYGGYEYLLYIDNDVLPEKEAIYRLARSMFEQQRSIMVPYVSEPGTGRPLHGPVVNKYSGIHPIRWAVLSMVMIKTAAFNAFPPGSFWDDAIGADEGFHYQKWSTVGHAPVINTEVLVPVYQAPTYPLTIEKQDNAEQEWKAKQDQFKVIPDRRPPVATDPRVSAEGVYMPFLPVMCQAGAGGCGQPKPGPWWKDSPVCGDCAQRLGAQAVPVDVSSPNGATPVGEAPRQAQKGEPGYYQQCAGLTMEGEKCNNKTGSPTGYCHIHADRTVPAGV